MLISLRFLRLIQLHRQYREWQEQWEDEQYRHAQKKQIRAVELSTKAAGKLKAREAVLRKQAALRKAAEEMLSQNGMYASECGDYFSCAVHLRACESTRGRDRDRQKQGRERCTQKTNPDALYFFFVFTA